MNQKQIDNLWFIQKKVPGAAFRLNDSVDVVRGKHSGQSGAVIALLELEPEPVYLVELSDGSDVKLEESALEAAA